MATFLVSFDFPGIHRYVFGVDMVRLVRGGSALVDRLNREDVPRLYNERLGAKKIYANGGNGLLVVDGKSEEELAAAAAAAADLVRKESGNALRLVVGWAPLDGSFQEAVDRAIRDRMLARYRPPEPVPVDAWGKRPRCLACGDEPVAEKIRVRDREWDVGKGCWAREQEGIRLRDRQDSPWSRVLEAAGFKAARPEELRPDDFQEIGEACTARRGYIAVVYGDGDGMGGIVQEIRDEGHYRAFAKAVDDAIFAATGQAVRELFGDELGEGQRPGLDILLIGGDDLVAIVRADRAVPFALAVMRRFGKLVLDGLRAAGVADQEPFRGWEPGLSTGVAIAHADQPFHELVERAEELLRSAKKKRKRGKPALDFEDVSQSYGLSIRDLRVPFRRTGTGRKILHGERPYHLEEAARVHAQTRKLLQAERVGSTRARNLFRLGLAGPVAGSFEIKRLVGRAGEERDRQPLLEFLGGLGVLEDPVGWKEVSTGDGEKAWASPLADVAQLFPYVEDEGGER